MNDLDTGAVAHAVERCSITRRSNISTPRSARRSAMTRAITRLCQRRGQDREQPRLAQYRPVADHQSDDGGRHGVHRLGLGQGRVHGRRRGAGRRRLLAQLFRPLDLLGMVYRTIRQGMIDMGGDVRPDRYARPRSSMRPVRTPLDGRRAAHGRFEDVRFGYDAGPRDPEGHRPRRAGRARRWRSSGRRARANRRSRGCCTVSTI